MSCEVRDQTFDYERIFTQQAERGIAVCTQQSPEGVGLMIVVYGKAASVGFPAVFAGPMLSIYHRLVSLVSESIEALAMINRVEAPAAFATSYGFSLWVTRRRLDNAEAFPLEAV